MNVKLHSFSPRIVALALIALAALWTLPAGAQNRLSTMRSGSVPTKDSLELNFDADAGSVRIFTDASGEVRYEARLEAVAGDPAAEALLKQFSVQARRTARGVSITGRMPNAHRFEQAQVSYEVHVPRRYNLAISTKAGDIVTQDLDGQAALATGGGNIRAGRIGGAGARGEFAARLATGGGEVLVGNVAGGLRASTAGGHITAGDVSGNAVLHTEGGHVQVGRVGGTAQLMTGGGNIAAAHLEDGVVAETAGGRIEFGEAAGAVHLRSGGGGVRIGRVAGPAELDCGSGGILLAGVRAPLHASSAAGGITAWFSPQFGGEAGASELASGTGDIVVYLPREIGVTIDATIEQGSNHRITADPAFPLKVREERSAAGGALHAQGALNGGGPVLRLKAAAGDIHLRFLDADAGQLAARRQMAAIEQEMMAQRLLLMEMEREAAAAFEGAAADGPMVQRAAAQGSPAAAESLTGIARLLESLWRGGLEVAPEEQQKRLAQAVRPEYPEAARQAGLEGDVTLRVVIGPDGGVREVRALAGDAELARAAVNAVAQWRYAPALLDGLPVNVITTVTLAFRLR